MLTRRGRSVGGGGNQRVDRGFLVNELFFFLKKNWQFREPQCHRAERGNTRVDVRHVNRTGVKASFQRWPCCNQTMEQKDFFLGDAAADGEAWRLLGDDNGPALGVRTRYMQKHRVISRRGRRGPYNRTPSLPVASSPVCCSPSGVRSGSHGQGRLKGRQDVPVQCGNRAESLANQRMNKHDVHRAPAGPGLNFQHIYILAHF